MISNKQEHWLTQHYFPAYLKIIQPSVLNSTISVLIKINDKWKHYSPVKSCLPFTVLAYCQCWAKIIPIIDNFIRICLFKLNYLRYFVRTTKYNSKNLNKTKFNYYRESRQAVYVHNKVLICLNFLFYLLIYPIFHKFKLRQKLICFQLINTCLFLVFQVHLVI